MIYIPKYPEHYEPKSATGLKDRFIWPAEGKVVALYSENELDYNPGIDIQVELGRNIVAIDDGTISFAGSESSQNGKKIVLLQHSGGFTSVYVVSGKLIVKEGEYVLKGQPILESPQDGTEYRILHFEIRKHHIPQNPYFYLSR